MRLRNLINGPEVTYVTHTYTTWQGDPVDSWIILSFYGYLSYSAGTGVPCPFNLSTFTYIVATLYLHIPASLQHRY
jgi:hypothetical protein